MDPNAIIETARQLGPAIEYGGLSTAIAISARKAVGRLLGAAVELPATWLDQKAAVSAARGKSKILVEEAIAQQAIAFNKLDADLGQRAAIRLTSKEYRRQENIENIAVAAIEDLRFDDPDSEIEQELLPDVDEDWLNVFERYAEDASTERMQKLWGRVLAGKVRQPGRFALRTLRFLSEFSQDEAVKFTDFCNNAFGEFAPKSLVMPPDMKDQRHLIYMETSGLVSGTSGLGLNYSADLKNNANFFLVEGSLGLMFTSGADDLHSFPVISLTPLGQDLISLLPDRDAREAARKVAYAIRSPIFKAVYLGVVDKSRNFNPMETLWQDQPTVVEAPV